MMLYTGAAEEETRKCASEFTKKYGIDVSVYRGTSAQAYQRWSQEAQANQNMVDAVVLSDPAIWRTAIDAELTARFTPSNADDFTEDAIDGHWYPVMYYSQ